MEYSVLASSQLTKPKLTQIVLSWYKHTPSKTTHASIQLTKSNSHLRLKTVQETSHQHTQDRRIVGGKPPHIKPLYSPASQQSDLSIKSLSGSVPSNPIHHVVTTSALTLDQGVQLRLRSNLGKQQQDLFFWNDHEVLVVNRADGHYRWLRLRSDWDNPQLTNPPQVSLGRFINGCQPSGIDVADMTTGEKVVEVICRTIPKVGPEAGEALKGLITPEALGWMAAFGAVYVAGLFTGASEIGTAVVGAAAGFLAICGAYFLGASIAQGIQLLKEFYTTTESARTPDDLERASKILAQAIATLGVDVVVGLLTRKASRTAKTMFEKKASMGAGEDPPRVTPKSEPEPPAPLRKSNTKTDETLPKSSALKAKDIDKVRGGHSNAEHGSQITPEQHERRLRTGEKPSGEIPKDKKGRIKKPPETSSSFTDDATQMKALEKTDAELANTEFVNNRATVVIDMPGAGTSYSLNPPRDITGNLTSRPANKVTAIYYKDPVTGKVSLITMFPN